MGARCGEQKLDENRRIKHLLRRIGPLTHMESKAMRRIRPLTHISTRQFSTYLGSHLQCGVGGPHDGVHEARKQTLRLRSSSWTRGPPANPHALLGCAPARGLMLSPQTRMLSPRRSAGSQEAWACSPRLLHVACS
jgi:hypothetical protein